MPKYKKMNIIFLSVAFLFFPLSYIEAGIVLSSHKYAWSDNVGYINFEEVIVEDDDLSGYAWSANTGFINLSPSEGGVLNDGEGNLSGSAWGEQVGWIDFDNVSIGENGKFSGTATGELVGTITFDCSNYCDVETDWRQASPPGSASDSNSSSSKKVSRRNPSFAEVIAPPLNINSLIIPGIPNTGLPAQVHTPISQPLFPSTGSEPTNSVINAAAGESAPSYVISEPVKVKEERKIFELFHNDLILYGITVVVVIVLATGMRYAFIRRRRRERDF